MDYIELAVPVEQLNKDIEEEDGYTSEKIQREVRLENVDLRVDNVKMVVGCVFSDGAIKGKHVKR